MEAIQVIVKRKLVKFESLLPKHIKLLVKSHKRTSKLTEQEAHIDLINLCIFMNKRKDDYFKKHLDL